MLFVPNMFHGEGRNFYLVRRADPPYLGLNLKDIGMSGADLLADRVLQNGDPILS